MAKPNKGSFDPILAQSLLRSGLQDLKIEINEGQINQLIDYLSLMAKWNPVYNLTAIRETDKMVSHHLLDSLAILPILQGWLDGQTTPNILDVGSGGGLPGIVLAIMQPQWHLTLIDPVHKKTAFLQQAGAQLALTNLEVITGKVEDLPVTKTYDVITSRAFASVADFIQLSQSVLAPNGFFAAMKGTLPNEEIAELHNKIDPNWQTVISEIEVPLLQAERHLVKITRQNLNRGEGWLR